ncbi:GvpL/GvpF family gas vesicle protein [Streptomyces griseus]|uniref:GvpL/GvpF family gas vesicle protein n=1 Tax=Streptomyces griseus TaxID=1911 RepID=UPI0009A11442|nr:GvpL/GvpF family gas vesicle protein [Streptomyces griseus]
MTVNVDPAAGQGLSYVYAVGRTGTPLDTAPDGRPGLEDGPLRTVAGGGLVAVVSTVPSASYDSAGIASRMADLDALEVLARTHHSVVEFASAHATVLPMRLATVYVDDARVRSMLEEREPEFGALLARLEGHVEMGVKVYADPRSAATPAPAGGGPGSGQPSSPGRAYLQQRRAQRQNHRDAYRAAGAVAAGIPARVEGLAEARVSHRPQQGELARAAGENIANEAYLVRASQEEEFRRALHGVADGFPGVEVEVTGPWAPYSFATPPESEGGTR